MTSDPYAPHLRQADDLFARGEAVKAGQIWQAILKQQPGHAEARERLLAVKAHLLALREAQAAAQAPPPAAPAAEPPAPAVATAPEPMPVVPEAVPAMPEVVPVMPEPAVAAPEPLPPVPAPLHVSPAAMDPERIERLVIEGCTLYDMGQLEDALKKWSQVLAQDPNHALARGYANGARRELGLAPLEAPEAQAPKPVEHHAADEDLDKLLREAVQLYDMGLVEEAISKWERVLVLEPERREVEGYLRQARAEVAEASSATALQAATPAPAPAAAAAADPDGLDLKLRQAEHLLSLMRHEEAAFTFQQALTLDPGNAKARQGLERCRKPSGQPAAGPESRPSTGQVLALDAQGRIAMAMDDPSPSAEPQAVEPPAAVVQAGPAPREGLSLPDRLRKAIEQLPWLKDTKVLAGIGGGLLVFSVGLGLVHSYRRDQALKEEVLAARAAATAPLAQQAQAPDLAESPAAIRLEAETALGIDPLRAFLRAETLVSRSPGDAGGAQLLEKARAGLPGGVTGASLAEFQKHVQNGDLEAALRVMDALLRAEPDSADLRARAARLNLALCAAHAGQTKWDEAQEDLQRGRALFPADKTWQARLRLLERVKAMPKNQQQAWIPLLG